MTLKKLLPMAAALTTLVSIAAHAAAPGITSTTGTTGQFNLVAGTGSLNQPDGQAIYSWGYGCAAAPPTASFVPFAGSCGLMQVPAPTMIVNEGQTVTVTLTNNLPTAAGNTSILFPGFQVTASAPASQPATCKSTTPVTQGLLTMEAANGCSITYTFVASSPGTRSYYSGTQGDLQIEMGMYGAIIVLPSSTGAGYTACNADKLRAGNLAVQAAHNETVFRLAPAAYDNARTCYDREYLFQFSEIDTNIHRQAYAQVMDPTRMAACSAGANSPGCSLEVQTQPYIPAYFLINGRSMPDDMDANYALEYPNQPYNGNPHMHPGELVLLRIIGQGRWQHPFHEHANHVRILARDGNLITDSTGQNLAGPLFFTTTTTPGLAMDGIFYYTGRGLNWDMYGHNPGSTSGDANATLPCYPDSNGYYTVNSVPAAPVSTTNYYEWCLDHNKPLEVSPLGDVSPGGPVTLPDPNIFTNGAWYSGSPYLGPDATARATGPNSVFQPADTQANPERAYAFMWHSHNEREITTNNVFPGGMFMMMLVDSREFVIDETK
ncbi:MAG TPA: multicopper oxidase family protein [Steroidobacteraceae bacterium]|jgi:FtsP/CotA-like multicopper oxidase with cupredoxin domain